MDDNLSDPWYVVMGIEINGLHSLTRAEDCINAAEKEEAYLEIHRDDVVIVSWPEHVITPRYNSDATYHCFSD